MQVDVLALIVSGLAYFFLGALWYSKVLFGNTWMKAMNFTEESMQNCELENGKCGTYKGMTYSFIGAFLAAFSLMQFFVFGDGSMAANLKYSLMAWLGFVAATQMGSVYFNYHDKSPGLIFIINTGYNLVGFTLIAVIQALL